ncbi:hypothetical protein HMSSN036_05610 [Paenibacillus macerans]|nr:hypothetical protein HMSSN036_05610 [Paenibacillus macerans]
MGQPGNTVTIDGRGFGGTAGTVYFGTTAVTGSGIVSWEDTQIKAVIPKAAAGKTGVSVKTSSGTASNTFKSFNVLTGDQVTVRFLVNQANTDYGTNVYLVGNVAELGSWDPNKAIGPMYNQVIAKYPSWYYDVSVPAGTKLEFKFIKKGGGTVTWEGGGNHTYTTPASGVGTVTVDWQN